MLLAESYLQQRETTQNIFACFYRRRDDADRESISGISERVKFLHFVKSKI
jgi:hypothetical protein